MSPSKEITNNEESQKYINIQDLVTWWQSAKPKLSEKSEQTEKILLRNYVLYIPLILLGAARGVETGNKFQFVSFQMDRYK